MCSTVKKELVLLGCCKPSHRMRFPSNCAIFLHVQYTAIKPHMLCITLFDTLGQERGPDECSSSTYTRVQQAEADLSVGMCLSLGSK